MSMYDTFIFAVPPTCPEGHPIPDWQTKNLSCSLDRFAVTVDGMVNVQPSGFLLRPWAEGQHWTDEFTDNIHMLTNCRKCDTWPEILVTVESGRVTGWMPA